MDAIVDEELSDQDLPPEAHELQDLPRGAIREATRKGVVKRQRCAASELKFGKQRVKQSP